VALLREQNGELSTLDLATLSGGQYSERLVPTIAELLERHGIARNSIGLIAVASGPGSFTGLRISIATVKGLAEAFATPVVAVSMLEAVALASGLDGRVAATLDAQRTEVFVGEYFIHSASSDAQNVSLETIASFQDFTTLLADPSSSDASTKVFTPDAELATRIQDAGFHAELLARPSAEDFARIAYRKFLNGIRADVATLDAHYLRRSDAEILVTSKSALTSSGTTKLDGSLL
jgi:tRNA threonylcarbamoyladenosine biosynthesis protein TsaB